MSEPHSITRQTSRCCRSVASASSLSVDAVWDWIAPVIPDHLECLGGDVFEAQWWSPVPIMDVEILMRTDGVTLIDAPFEPAHLPGGLAVRFSMEGCLCTPLMIRRF